MTHDEKNLSLDDVLAIELDREASAKTPETDGEERDVPPAASVDHEQARNRGTQRREKKREPTGSARHSLAKCACADCQARRVTLAREWGISTLETADSAEYEIDAKIAGKILTVFHTYKFTSLSQIDRELADVWRVSEETEATLGEFGARVAKKWLARADFRYRDEALLGLLLISDLGIRIVYEQKIRRLKTLEKEDGK